MRIAQGRIEVELHPLAPGEGRALLLLHSLYGSSAEWREGRAPWRGPVFALDFAGHGRSRWHKGGAYTPELLACNVDEALRAIGPAALAGAGLGAWVALLVAGARPDVVSGALLLPGAGLEGGGSQPDWSGPPENVAESDGPRPGCDPALSFLERDVRPVEYAAPFARKARGVVLLEDGGQRPPWWTTVRQCPSADQVADAAAGLALLEGSEPRSV